MAKTEQTRSAAALLWIAGIVAIVVVIYFIRLLTRETIAVHVASASFQTLSSSVSTNGKIAVVGEFQAHAPMAGVVQKVYVEVGDHVAAGARLLEMDSADARKQLAAAQANVAIAQSSLHDLDAGGSAEERSRFSTDINAAKNDRTQAETNLAVVKNLFSKGAASAAEVTVAQQKLDAATNALRNATARTSGRYSTGERTAAEARLADARAGVAAAQATYNAVSIHSPIAGTVYSVPVSAFDYVPAGDDLMDVANLNRIEVLAYFDEPEIGKLAHGQPVVITWDAKPGRAWHGTIDRAPTTVMTYGTRNVGECIITVDDAHGDLLPNTNVTVKVTESQRVHVLSVPREALHTEGLTSYVYRLVNGKLARTVVQVGIVNQTGVEITSGLSDKDLVVLGTSLNGRELSDGLTVKVAE